MGTRGCHKWPVLSAWLEREQFRCQQECQRDEDGRGSRKELSMFFFQWCNPGCSWTISKGDMKLQVMCHTWSLWRTWSEENIGPQNIHERSSSPQHFSLLWLFHDKLRWKRTKLPAIKLLPQSETVFASSPTPSQIITKILWGCGVNTRTTVEKG